jgi:allantoinase
VHAELPSSLREPSGDPRHYSTWLASRPPEAEHGAIDMLIRLAREYRVRVHVVHLASAGALPALARARAEGLAITVETCPHYLTFAAEEIGHGATAFKCAPPIRAADHREALWAALASGDIDLIATDHSPAPPSLKCLADGNFVDAWGGIASLQLGLGATWTEAAARGLPMDAVVRWLSTAPASLAGLSHAKGSIAPGCDADLVIWDPDVEVTVDAAALYHRHPVSPYHDRRLRGRVQTTLLRGAVIYDAGECRGDARGQLLDAVGRASRAS